VAGRLDQVVISVEVAASADEDLCAAVTALVPQLSSSAPPPSAEALARMVADPGTTLFVARDDGRIVGMLTLVTFEIPTAVRAWIEDVVVDGAARGQGAAAALVQAALRRAGEVGARTVDLTSRPDREAANRLYLRMGFEVRRTNVYRRDLRDPDG
jgi:ribosomal protein S18 acetylase RimI-like enzyme